MTDREWSMVNRWIAEERVAGDEYTRDVEGIWRRYCRGITFGWVSISLGLFGAGVLVGMHL